MREKCLVVDDEMLIAMYLRSLVEKMGLEVCGLVSTAEEAIAVARREKPGVILMDVRLQGEADGVDVANVLHEELRAKVIFVTGSREPSTLLRIKMDHPHAVLIKPIDPEALRRALTT